VIQKKFNLKEEFKKIVKKNGNKIAINYGNEKIYDFNFLNDQSNKLLLIFKKLKIKKNDIIAIDSEKNINSYILIIACIKNNNPYSFIDISDNNFRLKKIFKILKPKIIFTFKKKIKKNQNECILKKDLSYKLIINNKLLNRKREKNKNIVYIMFTSGSTGDPKGVPITHYNLSFFIPWVKKTFKINEKSIISNLNPLHFDNSIFDIYGGLFNGATIVPFEKQEILYPKDLINKINNNKCDTWFSVPSLLNYILELNTHKLFKGIKVKKLIFGGERFPINGVKKIFPHLKKVKIFNVSGPTECTCMCSAKLIEKKELFTSKNLSIGKINNYFKYSILKNNKPSNIGELVLKGPAVASGYFNDNILSKKKFFKKKYFGYYTGDIVHRLKNGELKILGRVDNQVKLMGHRIELEEIENMIIEIFNIKDCLIKLIKKTTYLKQELTLFVLKKEKNKFINFYDKVEKKLPTYAIPKKIKFIDDFKYNVNGKVDRNFYSFK